MNFSPQERSMLYASYLKLAAAGSDLSDMFYRRLFELDPELEKLFKTAMRYQGLKWRLMLNQIVGAIDQPTMLERALREMGKRHTQYGVKTEDYITFTEAFLSAMRTYMGAEFTPEIEAVWHKLFDQIVDYATNEALDAPSE